MKAKVTLVALALCSGALTYLIACGSGGGGGEETTISGNVSQRTAARSRLGVRPNSSRVWRLSNLVGTAYAHGGVDGLDVCVERCPGGLDSAANCAAHEDTGLCTSTDEQGAFTMRGDVSGDLCVRVNDADDPGFTSRACVANVPGGGSVQMSNMSCHRGDHTCVAENFEMGPHM